MNHNSVISIPSDGSSTYVAGDIVRLDTSGNGTAVPNTGSGVTGIGVVLQDVKADETNRPIDIQLFSGGGIVNVNANGAISKGDRVGYADGAKLVTAAGANKIGIALEALASGDGLIQVILQ